MNAQTNEIDKIITLDYSIDQNTSVKITNNEYIRLAAGARDYVIGRGKNIYTYCIVHTTKGFVNLLTEKNGFKIEWLSDPFQIKGVVADDQNNYFAELGMHGNIVRLPFEQLVPDKIHAVLFSKGIASKRTCYADEALSTHLQWLLSKFKSEDAAQTIGWRGNTETLTWHGGSSEPALLQHQLSMPSEEEYFSTLSNLLRNCPALQFVICAAAASTVLAYLSITEKLPLAPFGVSLVGTSSTGKTTALQLAASFYSSPDDETVLSGFYGTQNALMHVLGRHNGVPLCYDETTIKNDISSSGFVYAFSEGKEKLRMNPDSTLRERRSWLCTALFSSENYLVDLSKVENLGLAARIITLDEYVYTRNSEHSEQIKTFAAKNYGIVGDRLATYLLSKHSSHISKDFVDIRYKTEQKLAPFHCKLTDRVSMNYAVIVMTAKLLNEIGVIVDVDSVMNICVFLHEKLSASADQGKNLVIKIFNYICCKYRNLQGIKWTTDKEGKPLKVEIIETTFVEIVEKCGIIEPKNAVKCLINEGFIICPEHGRRKTKISIDGVPCYGYRFDLKKVQEAFGIIDDSVYSNIKKYKSFDPFSDETLDIVNDEEAVIHEGNYRIESNKTAVSGRAYLL